MDMDEAVPALAVVDARFCAGDEAALAVAKTLSMSGNDFTVTDAATGDVLLRVDGVLFSLKRRCLLADAHRRPVLTVQESVRLCITKKSILSPHSVSFPSLLSNNGLVGGRVQALVMNKRWKVFRGDSTSRRDLLFTVVKPSVIPLRWSTKVNVFLASNDAEQSCDFRITGSYHDGACSVTLGDSNTIIAKASKSQHEPISQPCNTVITLLIRDRTGLTDSILFPWLQIDRRSTVVSTLLGKNTYSVTVNPGIDYAFIVALAVVLDEMHYQ
jgi:uncharacterized protein YxjI